MKEPSEGQTLRFVSWNVHGVTTKIRSKPKFDYVSEELIKQGADIVFLQETHIGPKNCALLNNPSGFSNCFFTVYDPDSKGVAIMISNDVSFDYICHDDDYSGGYLVLFCYLHHELFTLVNVYNHKHDREILNRLQDYLRETAEGVLLVGGDFNTVMDLTLDRKSKSLKHRHTQLRDMFGKFTASLNLMDAWVHLYPTDQVLTRSQNDSFSRLDMFLIPEDIIERVSDVKICKANMIPNFKEKNNMRKISDHDLLVLSLTFCKCPTRIPRIASWPNKYKIIEHERAGKINGAEILSVINSMTDSNQIHFDGISIESYKMYRCPYSEVLKIYFNHLLCCKEIPDCFKNYKCVTGIRKIFNVDYLIFTMILAKRLSMLLLLHPETERQLNNVTCYLLTFSAKPVRIKWIVLKKILTYLGENWKQTKTGKHQPLSDFRILETLGFTEDFQVFDNILPKVSSTSDEFRDDFRELQEGCPLARSIHSLVLKYLQIHINSYRGYDAHICSFRQVVVICKKKNEIRPLKKLRVWKQLENGTKLRIIKMVKR